MTCCTNLRSKILESQIVLQCVLEKLRFLGLRKRRFSCGDKTLCIVDFHKTVKEREEDVHDFGTYNRISIDCKPEEGNPN